MRRGQIGVYDLLYCRDCEICFEENKGKSKENQNISCASRNLAVVFVLMVNIRFHCLKISTALLSFLSHLKNATGLLSFLAKIVLSY